MNWYPLKPLIGTGRGKNVLKFTYLRKAILFLDSEIDLFKFQIRYPDQFLSVKAQTFKPTLSLIPKSENLGVMGMAEILTSLSLLEGINDNTGKNPDIIALADTFEQAFGFSYNDIYDRQYDLFRRKPCNLTKTLDAMKTALMKEYKRRKSQRDKKENEKR